MVDVGLRRLALMFLLLSLVIILAKWGPCLEVSSLKVWSFGILFFVEGILLELLNGTFRDRYSQRILQFLTQLAGKIERPLSQYLWRRFCLTLVYACAAIWGFLLCYGMTGQWIPPVPWESNWEDTKRLIWCISWSLIGFAIIAAFTIRKSKQNPFPSYLYFYPLFLLVNSLLVYGLLNIFQSTRAGGVFYPLGAWLGVSVGFWIDRFNLNRILDVLVKKATG